MKINRILNILIAVLIIVLVFVFSLDYYKKIQHQKLSEQAEQEASINRVPTDENAINLVGSLSYAGDSEDDVFLSYEGFLNGCTRTSYHVGETSVSYRFSRTLTSGGSNVYLLNFKMRAEDEAAKVNVKFGIEHEYYVTTEWRDYYVPCTQGKIDSIKIALTTPFQKLYLSDVQVIRYDPLLVDFHYTKNGSYSVEEIPTYAFEEADGIGVGLTMDVECDGEYLYSAGSETLTISAISESGTSVVSTLGGIGNIRHLEIRDSKHIAAASRETGVYLINIEDKASPFIESYYDSLELANDVCFTGNYMIVAGRYFGVEIVDISDVSNPVYITRIVNDKECFRCTVDESYLYVSCWATSEVEIYDISILSKPILVNTIKVTGRCAETFIEGNIAYIVSGYSNLVNADNVGDAGYGTGNALAIYDVSDAKRPVWHSTIQAEGMLYGNGYDDWSVQVSGGYAYFTNSFGGMYVYDVTDTKAPVAVAHLAVELPNSSSKYIDFSKNTKAVFPYDVKEKIYSPAMGVSVADGKLFFACAYNDVYEFEFSGAKTIGQKLQTAEYKLNEKTSLEQTAVLTEYDVYKIVKHEDKYIVATGEGLLLLDESLSVLARYITEKPVKDVSITASGTIATAETVGIGVYKIEGNELVRTGFVQSQTSNRNVSSLGVTGDGNYAVVQSSWTKYEIADIRDVNNPLWLNEVVSKSGNIISTNALPNAGNMYYRNIVSGTIDGSVGIGGGANMVWFKSENGSLCVKNYYPNILGSEINGSAALKNGKEMLTVYGNGIMVYAPLEATENSLTKLERYYVPNVRLKGKISIRDNILAVSNAPSGNIQLVNIANTTRPYLMASYNVENSPGIALIEDGFILVPLRHGGIMKIDIE